jgi:hypothetical protein
MESHFTKFNARQYPLYGNIIFIGILERKKNYTLYGKHQGSIKEPNMWLDLEDGDNDHKQYLVVHEFGHALGLGHEHQRPDFWEPIEPFVNKEMMKSDTGACCGDWEVDENLKDNCNKATAATTYDRKSVMHYW